MKVVLQRCQEAKVTVDDKVVGAIAKGYVLLVGVSEDDVPENADYLAKKIAQLRIFEDDNGKMNQDIHAVNGTILSISQFTLLADTKKGNRPSFVKAAKPDKAIALYDYFNQQLQSYGLHVEMGIFGANMQVSLVNDGPVTIIFDTNN